ncbi:MAG: hypothetical protein RL331_102 [Bacteroidota bacterium]|jgi:hypothetical protein
MKKIFASIAVLLCFVTNAQVLEKPQLVEKIDTSSQSNLKVVEIAEPPIQITEVMDITGEAEDRSTPQFPGGQEELDFFLKDAVESFIFADTNETFPWGESVYVAFEVATDGQLSNPLIEMGYNAALDSAALEIVRRMPLWLPALDENGTPIVASYRLQIIFDLDLEIDDDFDFEDEFENSTKAHWAGFELGFQLNTLGFLDPTTTFSTTPYWENNSAKSILLNFNAFQHKFNLIGDVFGITTGYGFNFGTTELTSSYVIEHTADTVFAVSDINQEYKRNSLYSAYMTVPVLLDYTANKAFKKSFYFNAGVIGGVRLYSHQRFTGTYANGNDFENITKSKFNLNTWMLDATVRAGYGYFGFFANYAILSMFKEGTTAGVYPLRFGISLNIPQ